VETVDPETGEKALRETDTMPGWAGSCWYYLRYMDPHNGEAPWSDEAQRYWGNVDLYVGGAEHAVLHLLYARFWHKVLFDLGLVTESEPFARYFNQGMLTAFAYKDGTGRLIPADEVEEKEGGAVHRETGEALEQVVAKMSKSLKNVVTPDEVVEQYGVDTFRVYEMFMGPLRDSKPWNTRDVQGSQRFLERAWRLVVDPEGSEPVRPTLDVDGGAEREELERELNRALERVDASFEHFNFNTAIAALMSFVNEVGRRSHAALGRSQAERFVLALSPFAPHVAEELWGRLGHEGSLARAPWPEVDESMLVDEEVEVVVQVKGKVRGRVKVSADAPKDTVEAAAREAVAGQLEGKDVVKVIVVPGKLVNIVVR
jgi:leucyl-tRNA synthetase